MKAVALALLLVFAIVATSARPLDFILRFRGSSKGLRNGFFALKGPSQSITTTISNKDAIRFEVRDVIGSFATINGHESAFTNGTFTSAGNITFGNHQFQNTHALYYKTLGLGHETRAPNSNEVSLNTIWQVFSGKGVFTGAYGTVVVACRFEPLNSADIVCYAIGNIFYQTK